METSTPSLSRLRLLAGRLDPWQLAVAASHERTRNKIPIPLTGYTYYHRLARLAPKSPMQRRLLRVRVCTRASVQRRNLTTTHATATDRALKLNNRRPSDAEAAAQNFLLS